MMGVVLYEILAGVHPRAAGPATAIGVVGRHLSYEPPLLETLGLDVPGDVSDLVRRAMAKVPGQRPSMAEMAEMLGKALRRLDAPVRAVGSGGLRMPGREGALAPTELALTAFGAGGTMRMGVFGGLGVMRAGGVGRRRGSRGRGGRRGSERGAAAVFSLATLGPSLTPSAPVGSLPPTWRSPVVAPVEVSAAADEGAGVDERAGGRARPGG